MNTKSYIGIVGVLVVLIALYAAITLHPAVGPFGNNVQPPQNIPPYYSRLSSEKINANWDQIISFANAPALGNPKAEYTLIEVGDFQCPQCGKVRPVLEQLIKTSGGKARLYFVNYPLPMHEHAMFAAEAALAAAKQNKFWPMYEVLYEHQDMLVPSEIQYYAGQEIKGFNTNQYLVDVNSAAVHARVQQQIAEDNLIQVDSTPTIFVRRTAGGTPAWYIGVTDVAKNKTKGAIDLTLSPPWTNGGTMP